MKRSFTRAGKKVLASAVSAAMVIAFTPMVAMGEDCEAQIGENRYATLEKAIAAVENGQEIDVCTDIVNSDGFVIDVNKSFTIDLNNHKITVQTGEPNNSNNRAFKIVNGTLTIMNGTVDAKGGGTSSTDGYGCYGTFRVEDDATLYAENLKLFNYRPWGLSVKVVAGGNATITNSTLTCSYGGGIEVAGGNATMEGCTLTQSGYFDHCSSALAASTSGTLTVKNSDVRTSTADTDNYCIYVFNSGATINISGGNYAGGKYVLVADNSTTATQSTINVSGGSFSGQFRIGNSSKLSISGGTFDQNLTTEENNNYIAEHCTVTKDSGADTWTVTKDPAAATVGETEYYSLEEAVAAGNGTTVTMQKNLTENITVPAGISTTIDLNGFTLSGGTASGKAAITNNGTLKIVDSSNPSTGKIIREDNGSFGYYTINNQGTMEIASGQVYNHTGTMPKGSSLILNAGKSVPAKLTISGGNIKQDGFIAVKNDDLGELYITGGTITTTGKTETHTPSAVQNWSRAEISGGIINGALWAGTWSDNYPNSVLLVSDKAEVNGDMIIRKEAASLNNHPIVSISGGKHSIGTWNIANDGSKLNLFGGTFNSDVSALMGSDRNEYKMLDGTYIVATTYPAHTSGGNAWSGPDSNRIYTEYYSAPSYDPPSTPVTPPATNTPEAGTPIENITIPSTPGDSGTAGSTKVDVTVTDNTAATDSKGNKVDGSVSIDKIETTGTAVAIPETITTDKGTFLVTSIPAGAMEGNTTATTVAIPESVTTIGEGAFSNCTALTTVTVPAGVTEIAFGTFAGCTSLEAVEIQGEVTQIASNAFSGCESLTEVSIPETVTTIGSGAFSGCSSLTSTSIPAGVSTIEANTFAGCTSLESVEVKGELTEIAADAFNGCESLTSMTVAGTVRPLATRAASSALVIPSSVTKIGDRAFKGTGITSVTVPAGVKMGTGVFRDCKQLTKAAVASKVKAISAYTFKGCSALKSVTIPGTVTKIERSAFSGCKSLAKVTIPKGVTSIGKNALYGASKVKTLTVNSKKLTKSSVKGALAGSKVTTVKVPKSMLKSYAKVFAKSVVGKTVKVRAI